MFKIKLKAKFSFALFGYWIPTILVCFFIEIELSKLFIKYLTKDRPLEWLKGLGLFTITRCFNFPVLNVYIFKSTMQTVQEGGGDRQKYISVQSRRSCYCLFPCGIS